MTFSHQQARTFLTLLLAAVAVAAFALAGSTGTVHASFGTINGKIAFERIDCECDPTIFSMNADGSEQASLGGNFSPSWSPDGTKIAFDIPSAIYVSNADGSGRVSLTPGGQNDQGPSWSPDGTKIAFSSHRDGNQEIYTMNADGSAVARLTNNAAVNYEPAWSPDGTKIAFFSGLSGGIYMMNVDGSNQIRLADGFAPSWSPDGTKIAFDRDNEIYATNSDGSGETRLTNNSASDRQPAWSPDGTKIAFASDRDGKSHVYTMNADGSGVTRLTHNDAVDDHPAWQSLTSAAACSVPQVVGRTPKKAKSLLSKAGCAKVKLTRPKTKIKRARRLRHRGFRLSVIRQSPKVSTTIARDTTVSLKLGWRR